MAAQVEAEALRAETRRAAAARTPHSGNKFRNPDLWENEVAPLQPVEAAQPSLGPGKFSHVARIGATD